MILLLIFLGLGWFVWDNKRVIVSHYKVRLKKIKKSFKIVQISDLHNQIFGKNQSHILEKVKQEKPDMVAVTGDLIDMRHPDLGVAMDLVLELKKVAPVYMVSGNHELWSGKWPELRKKLQKSGIKILDKTKIVLRKNRQKINIWGIGDPGNQIDEDSKFFGKDLKKMTAKMKKEEVNILLSHRPEKFLDYVDNNFDLVLSGHAHGGQVRLPILGGLVAPHQRILPDYDAGVFKKDRTRMIVSRGLGNSLIPLRIFNSPEIVVVNIGLQ